MRPRPSCQSACKTRTQALLIDSATACHAACAHLHGSPHDLRLVVQVVDGEHGAHAAAVTKGHGRRLPVVAVNRVGLLRLALEVLRGGENENNVFT